MTAIAAKIAAKTGQKTDQNVGETAETNGTDVTM
jgi:hypothetical protein